MRPSHPANFPAAWINLSHHASYLHWSFILVSLPNLLVIALMFVVFFAAVLLPMPERKRGGRGSR